MPLWREGKRRRQETDDLLSLALEASGAGVWSWDLATRKVVWSERTAELFGTTLGDREETYESFLERVHPEDRETVARNIEEASRNRTQCRQECRIVLPDGSLRWIPCLGRFFYDDDGQPVRLAGTVLDVTDQKTARQTLHVAKEAAERRAVRLKLLSETSAELLSHECPRDLMESIFRRFSSHLKLEVYFNYLFDPGENRLNIASCSGIPQEILPDLQQIELGQAVCGTVALEKRPMAVEDVQSSREERVQLIRSLGITAYACHPLMAGDRLLGTLSFGTRGRSRFDPGELDLMRTLCDQVASAVERSQLIDELRQRSREAEEAREAAEAANRTKDEFLATLSHELRTPLTPVLLTAGALATDARLPRLRQVFGNLLSNALKFTPPDGAITVRTFAGEGGRIAVEVRDSGAGIAPDLLPRIFNAFEQGGSQVTRRFGGLGLGLAIARNLIELHGGSIAAASDGPGRGAVFTVTLPVVDAPAAGAQPEPERRQAPEPSLHILLVEDHADTAEAIAELLRARGYRVTVALTQADGLAAVAAGKDGAPSVHVVVSDLGLPDGSGLDLMREVSRRYGLSGIAVSGYGTEEDIRQSRQAGFAEHLTKPIALSDLEAALQKVIALG